MLYHTFNIQDLHYLEHNLCDQHYNRDESTRAAAHCMHAVHDDPVQHIDLTQPPPPLSLSFTVDDWPKRGFVVRVSNTDPTWGNGLYCLYDILKGTELGEYVGDRIPDTSANDRNNPYYFNVRKSDVSLDVSCVIDAGNPATSSLARFVNHVDEETRQNCEFRQVRKRVFLYSICDIPKESELLAHYGKIYF